jgi:hypothetical protein
MQDKQEHQREKNNTTRDEQQHHTKKHQQWKKNISTNMKKWTISHKKSGIYYLKNRNLLQTRSKFYKRTCLILQKLYVENLKLILMIDFHSCENLKSIFTSVFTYKGANQFSLWESN